MARRVVPSRKGSVTIKCMYAGAPGILIYTRANTKPKVAAWKLTKTGFGLPELVLTWIKLPKPSLMHSGRKPEKFTQRKFNKPLIKREAAAPEYMPAKQSITGINLWRWSRTILNRELVWRWWPPSLRLPAGKTKQAFQIAVLLNPGATVVPTRDFVYRGDLHFGWIAVESNGYIKACLRTCRRQP